jgi:hypothetical protein
VDGAGVVLVDGAGVVLVDGAGVVLVDGAGVVLVDAGRVVLVAVTDRGTRGFRDDVFTSNCKEIQNKT